MDTLHRLSAFLFYVLGSLGFLSFIFLRNGVYGAAPAFLLDAIKMPFLTVALLYGGLSIALSLRSEDGSIHRGVSVAVFLPMFLLFFLSLYFNFRHLLP